MSNSAKSAKLKVLYCEGDPEVLAAQAVSIQKAGHQSEAVVGRKGAEEALRKASYDLIILGGTLSRNDRHHIPYMSKKAQPNVKVVVLHTDGERHPYVDGNIDTGRNIEELLGKAQALFPAAAAETRSKAASAGR